MVVPGGDCTITVYMCWMLGERCPTTLLKASMTWVAHIGSTSEQICRLNEATTGCRRGGRFVPCNALHH